MPDPSIFIPEVLTQGATTYRYFSLSKAGKAYSKDLTRLPYCLRILLEGTIRTAALKHTSDHDLLKLINWTPASKHARPTFEYQPGRVLLQDLTGVPVVVDLASLRAAAARAGKDPDSINPMIPVDLVVDHSIQVDAFGSDRAILINQDLEYQRNQERYALLKWAQSAFRNVRIIPPATGIVHQVNLEFLSQVVLTRASDLGELVFPDTVIGTDSHTTMVNGLGVLGWGVGGIEAIAAMLDQPVEALLPDVLGVHLTGKMPAGATPTDLVLTLTHLFRKLGVVNKMIEFYGDALNDLPVADRAMIANMSPEYGATSTYFPVDDQTLAYLAQTGRPQELIDLVEAYYRAQGLFRENGTTVPEYSQVMELDLSTIRPAIAGPKRPQDLAPLDEADRIFRDALIAAPDKRGYGLNADQLSQPVDITIQNETVQLDHGSVVLAAITSCTNTSNPTALVAAALLAKKAVELGLKVKPYTKTSLAPGSRVVTDYLRKADLLPALEALGFHVVGYGCTTCIGNSGPLIPEVTAVLESHKLISAAVISGNRNFEGRVHPNIQANFLASPALVVAYALAGTMNLNLTRDSLGTGTDGRPVYLADIWPSPAEVQSVITAVIGPDLFRENFANVLTGDERWQTIPTAGGKLYEWDKDSTYLRETTFCEPQPQMKSEEIEARILTIFGDSITTDHISPAGSIAKDSPAAQYLRDRGVAPADFNTYGTRRGNHEVMARGTFANIRIKNLMLPGVEGSQTVHYPDGARMSIFDASEMYQKEGVDLVVLAGKEYGSGSSRDWAAKGPQLLGVRAILAESFERIHRSNLIGMGILPLQFAPGSNAASIGLTGDELIILHDVDQLKPGCQVRATVRGAEKFVQFQVSALINSEYELECFRSRGVFQLFMKNI